MDHSELQEIADRYRRIAYGSPIDTVRLCHDFSAVIAEIHRIRMTMLDVEINLMKLQQVLDKIDQKL